MAEGFVRHLAGDRVEAKSAGSHPEPEVQPNAVQVMKEVGIDISDHRTKSLESVKDESFDWVITLCDSVRDFCPVFRGKDGDARHIHWPITDPYRASNDPQRSLEIYREVRDEIETRIKEWLKNEFKLDIHS